MDKFWATRKGKGVRISALVARPDKNLIPSIIPCKERRAGWRSYRLMWHTKIGGLSRSAPDPADVDYLDEDVPLSVKTLRIYLPSGREHIIESKR